MNTQIYDRFYDPFVKLDEQGTLADLLHISTRKIRHNDLRLFIEGEERNSGRSAFLNAVQEQVVSDTLLGRREKIEVVNISAVQLVEALEWRKRVESCYGSLQRRQLEANRYVVLVDDFHLLDRSRSVENLLKPFIKRTYNIIIASREAPSKDLFDDFEHISIRAINSPESIEKILHAYIAKFNVTRVTDIMVQVLVELVFEKKLSIDEAKIILRRVKIVNANLTRAVHSESFHHLFFDFDLVQMEVRKLVWGKLGENRGGK